MSQPQKGAKGRAAAASLSATAKKDAGERFFEAVDELISLGLVRKLGGRSEGKYERCALVFCK